MKCTALLTCEKIIVDKEGAHSIINVMMNAAVSLQKRPLAKLHHRHPRNLFLFPRMQLVQTSGGFTLRGRPPLMMSASLSSRFIKSFGRTAISSRKANCRLHRIPTKCSRRPFIFLGSLSGKREESEYGRGSIQRESAFQRFRRRLSILSTVYRTAWIKNESRRYFNTETIASAACSRQNRVCAVRQR